jgi:hypothetical protein
MKALDETKLGAWLRKEKPEYFYKAEELRETVTGWLGYIVQTFPHYTRHTVDHSDNIVQQMSHLLFRDNRKKPEVALSPIEAYVLIAAAYLHDAGMVVPDREKQEILASEEWKRWIAGERWEKVEAIRRDPHVPDPAVRDFLADVYTRHLIAEFVRRVHHRRAARVIAEHPATFAHFSLRDPLVARTIADVCIGHGLSHNELEDHARYPEHRQLAGDSANVRWMAILLRLGDLLDMRADRACPLLLNAAAPLPPESIVHWTQYEKLTQLSVTPKRIEIAAACDTRDEYQVLRDWTQWIEDEVKNAALVMRHAERHAEWKVPATKIAIGKSETARFLIDDWKFELDRDAIFERLIYDVYDKPITFIRELIQNALDATRVQMYLDLDAAGIPRPEYPTEIEESRREEYPVEIALETRTINGEERQVFSITDRGVGMDRDVISRYLLQIGRSYYTSDEFRKDFRFVPTSRFGVGFLSVFAVADQVTIDTYKTATSDGPLQLVLRGVRNYVLPQVSERTQRGTQIQVLLREPIDTAQVIDMLEYWCRRVEVPIRATTNDGTKVIHGETSEEFESHVPDVDVPGAEWHVRAHPFDEGGVRGEIYIDSRLCDGVEEFAEDRGAYNAAHPLHRLPGLPDDVRCLHGIRTGNEKAASGWSYRIDVRRPMTTTLSRSASGPSGNIPPEVLRALESVLRSHLERCPSASSAAGWQHLQDLATKIDMMDFWRRVPMIPMSTLAGMRLLTLEEVAQQLQIATAHVAGFDLPASSWDVPAIAASNTLILQQVTDGRIPLDIQFDGFAPVSIKWSVVGVNPDYRFAARYVEDNVVVLISADKRIATVVYEHDRLSVNRNHPLAEWIRAARNAVECGTLADYVIADLLDSISRVATYAELTTLDHWRGPAIPPELRLPPLVRLAYGVLGSPDPDDPPPTPPP